VAHLKTARAEVTRPFVTRRQWGEIRTASRVMGRLPDFVSRVARNSGVAPPTNLVDQAAGIFGSAFDPRRFLLTHATIVASVDVYTPEGVRLGSSMEDGFQVNRKFGDYRIKDSCQRFINNNRDAWSRPVLLKAFDTFIGGHNFVEHVQIESMSKGRIIDACARDIGDSVYIDILIATDRKHADLVTAIRNEKMGTLSMGCTVDGTICTKCGHWAADETEMCPHIKYEKGNTFFDKQGRSHIVAELCGHESLAPTGGVTFIEASWVETPAFTGAVMRNVLEATAEISKQAEAVLASPPPEWDADALQKAASNRTAMQPFDSQEDAFLAGWDDMDEGGEEDEEGGEEGEPEKGPLEEAEEELTQHLVTQVQRKVKDQMKGKDVDEALGESSDPNDTMQLEAGYKAGVRALVRTASSDIALVNGLAEFNQAYGVGIPVPVYRAALKLGASNQYSGSQEFSRACRVALGREPSAAEVRVLARLSHLLTRRVHAQPGHDQQVVATGGE